MKKDYNVVQFSGGKDSTAMLLHMIELNMPIDEIIFCDTGLEFPEMYEHIEKVEKYIGRKITRLKHEKSFEYCLLDRVYTIRGGYIFLPPPTGIKQAMAKKFAMMYFENNDKFDINKFRELVRDEYNNK